MKNKCLVCEKEFKTYPCRNGKYCSMGCAGVAHGLRISGDNNPRRKVRPFGNLNPAWKGKKAGYVAIHIYIKNRLGKASSCVMCHKAQKFFTWANKDHKYTRDLNDWFSLCYSCHANYDYKHNNKQKGGRPTND